MINLPRMTTPGSLQAEGAAVGNLKIFKLAPSVLGIIVCIIVIVLVVWPKFNAVVKLRSENKQLEMRVLALEDKAKLLSSFSHGRLEDQFTISERLLPSDKAVFSMVSQIEKAASVSGVILNKLDLVPGAVSDQGSAPLSGGTVAPTGAQGEITSLGVDTPRIQVKVSITSDYLSALRFLKTLVSFQRVVAISDLAIGANSTTGGGSLRATMVVNAFWKPLPKELPAIEAPVADITDVEAKLLESIASIQEASASAIVPKVPLGRPDLFAPF